MVDKKNKGGKSLVMRCVSALKYGSSCPFHCKLMKDVKRQKWYICGDMEIHHTCESVRRPSKILSLEKVLVIRSQGAHVSSPIGGAQQQMGSPKRKFDTLE